MIAFGAPWLLAGLVLPVLVLVVALHAARRRREVAGVLGGPSRARAAPGGRAQWASASLLAVATTLAVLAAARPQWGEEPAPVTQRGVDLVIALDVSRSMEAGDVPPSRAGAAASGLSELLSHMTGSRVGLVTFAGSAFARAPLTTDLEVVRSLVVRAQGEAPLVTPGTDLRDALTESIHILDVERPAATRVILLVSDGEDLGSEYQEAIATAGRGGVRIYTVFVGTTDPASLPEQQGVTDVTVADPALLSAIAEASGGSMRAVDSIPGLAVEFRRLQQTTFEEAPEVQLQERFAWFAGGAILLLLLASFLADGRRARMPRLRGGVIAALLAAVAFLAGGCGTAAWQQVERGNEAYAAGDLEAALDAYRAADAAQPADATITYNIAAALHGLGRHLDAQVTAAEARELALAADDRDLAVRAWSTAGNSAFLAQDLAGAQEAYQAALRLDPADADAKANLELVYSLLQPPEQPDTDEGDAPPEGAGDGAGEDGEPEEGGEAGEQPSDGGSGSDGPDVEGTPSPGTSAGTPGGEARDLMTPEEAREALAEALGELGDQITAEEAQRLLELARRSNELQGLPERSGSGPTPR